MSKRKLLSVEKDTEELFNILFSDQNTTAIAAEVEDAEELQFVLPPPLDGQDSDRDDAPSDREEASANIKDIGRGVLSQRGEVRIVSRGEKKDLNVESITSDEPTTSNKTQRKTQKKTRKWKSKKLESSRVDSSCDDNSEVPAIVKTILDQNLKPVDLFKLCFDDEIMNHICNESGKYAFQKGDSQFTVSVEELYRYFAILLLSGYNKMPFRRMYWETRPDANNFLVSQSMSRNRFEKIHQFLHFNDNMKMDGSDRVFKMRPLLNHLNSCFFRFFQPLTKTYSLDEAMEPYYGHHSMKQFIRGKPIRYGFKLWCLTSPQGYLVKFFPYTGSDKILGKPVGVSVTEKLCIGFIPQGSCIYMDNYFTSLSLMDTLTQENLFAIGTIRSDRVEKAPLQDLRKSSRGSFCSLQESQGNILLVRWNDNSQVTLITNLRTDDVFQVGSCKRWKRSERKQVTVPQPHVVKLYNKNMCGVDLFDKLRGHYRIRIRSRKWYWPLFRFCLNGSVINLWLLYRNVETKMSLLEFTRQIVISLLASPNMEKRRGVAPKTKKQVLDATRLDGKEHFVDKITTQRRCASCGKCAKFICIKCNVALHPAGCFVKFHQ